jgi:hypothetical protein
MSTLDKKVDILSRWVGGQRSRIKQTERSQRHGVRPGDLVLLNGGARGATGSITAHWTNERPCYMLRDLRWSQRWLWRVLVFCSMAVCSLLKINRLWCLLHADFLLGLLFNHGNGGDTFLRNVLDFQQNSLRYIPEGRTFHMKMLE